MNFPSNSSRVIGHHDTEDGGTLHPWLQEGGLSRRELYVLLLLTTQHSASAVKGWWCSLNVLPLQSVVLLYGSSNSVAYSSHCLELGAGDLSERHKLNELKGDVQFEFR